MFEAVIVTGAPPEGDLTKQVQRCAGGPRAKGIRVSGNGDVLSFIPMKQQGQTGIMGFFWDFLSSKKSRRMWRRRSLV